MTANGKTIYFAADIKGGKGGKDIWMTTQNEKGEWIHKIKLSEQTAKVTNPGILQVRRFFDGHSYLVDAIYDELLGIQSPCTIVDPQDPNLEIEGKNGHTDLLVPIFRKGKLVYSSPSLLEMQQIAKRELSRLPPAMERVTHPQLYVAGLEKTLYQKKLALIKRHL